jgi:hypothetical protein
MFNLIRHELMEQDETPLVDEVEADETSVGGAAAAARPAPRP